MKKFVAALSLALTFPLSVNAAIDLTGHNVVLASVKNTYTQKGTGVCYGLRAATLSQKTKIKQTDPGFGQLGGMLTFTTAGAANDPVTWHNDMLLDQRFNSIFVNPVTLNGIILSRSGDKLIISFDPADQLKMATALLAYSDAYPDLLANASLDSLPKGPTKKPVTPYVFKFDAKTSKMTETSYIQSFDGPCTLKAKIVRSYRG